MRWLALGGVVGPALYVAVFVLCGALRPGYQHATQFISELGAAGTPHAALMNFAGFLPAGVLIAGFAASLGTVLPRRGASTAAAVLVGLFGLGMILAGSFPCAPGCPQDRPTVHDGVSIAAFLAASAGFACAAASFRKAAAWRSLWTYSAVSSAATLLFLGMLAASIPSRTLTGVWQRLLVATVFLWCAVVGLRGFRLAGSGGEPA